jgi:virginiamycin A acetyltransferase
MSEIAETANIYKDVKLTDSVIGPGCSIGDNSVVYKSELVKKVSLDRNTHVAFSSIGFGTYINHFSTVRDAAIGKFCSISWNVSIGGKNHEYTNASNYPPYWWAKTLDLEEPPRSPSTANSRPKCIVGNDVWIGSGAIILRNVTVGDGAIIGAGSVVTKDVEPYTIVVGTPARPIGKRFDDNVIAKLLEAKWWDWPEETLRENMSLILDHVDSAAADKLLAIARAL